MIRIDFCKHLYFMKNSKKSLFKTCFVVKLFKIVQFCQQVCVSKKACIILIDKKNHDQIRFLVQQQFFMAKIVVKCSHIC